MWALEKIGYRAILINNNPETVSTDWDTSDGLYFEPVTLPDVLKVCDREKPIGVMTQFGGQTAINLAEDLHKSGVVVLGTSADSIAAAEDRRQFDALLESLGIARPQGEAVGSLTQAIAVADRVGYPVLVRPSFVLGGRAMMICQDQPQLEHFYREAEDANPGQPVLVDKYLVGTEVELDVISDGDDCFVPGIMQHVERAGVHSGDSMAVFPPVSLSESIQTDLVLKAIDLARALRVKGLMNIQFVVHEGKISVIEVNPRASRTVPYLSKVTGIAMVELATRCAMGQNLRDLGYESGLWQLLGGASDESKTPAAQTQGTITDEPTLRSGGLSLNEPILFAVKAPVFSFQKLTRVDPSLGPEMKSTGEILGIDTTYEAALYKAMIASGVSFKSKGAVVITVADEDKGKAIQVARDLSSGGHRIMATRGTAQGLREAGVSCEAVNKIQEGSPHLLDLLATGEVCLMINTPKGGTQSEESIRIRRGCIESGVACVTNIDTAQALARSIQVYANPSLASCKTLDEYLRRP